MKSLEERGAKYLSDLEKYDLAGYRTRHLLLVSRKRSGELPGRQMKARESSKLLLNTTYCLKNVIVSESVRSGRWPS